MFLLSTPFEITGMFFALICSVTVMAVNIPRIKSKAKTVTEAVLLFVSFLIMAILVMFADTNAAGWIFSMLILSSVVITCFLKCRAYLGNYSLKEAFKNPNILPFICIAVLYAVLIGIAITVAVIVSIIAEVTMHAL